MNPDGQNWRVLFSCYIQNNRFEEYLFNIWESCFHAISKNIVLKNLYSIFGSLSISYLGEISARVPLSQPFTKPISIHYGSPCFLNRFRITFCAFQEGPKPNHLFQDILFLCGATCMAFYVIALMGNSCYVKSEILANYCEAGCGNWHYVKTLHHHFISCQQHTHEAKNFRTSPSPIFAQKKTYFLVKTSLALRLLS